jgi:transketolase
MTTSQSERLTALAREMRLIQAEMSRAYPCYLGSSLSVTDILAVLYGDVLQIRPEGAKDQDRDVLVLSKGHASPALYAALCLRGFIPKEDLLRHCTVDSPIYYHPSNKVHGVELSTGSLGQGLSFGLGTALAQKSSGYAGRTFVILGDGELDEGSNWEAILSAPGFEVGNLIAIVDRNGIQANKRTEDLVPLNDLAAKWKAFNWRVEVIDGHDIGQIHKALSAPTQPQSQPLVVIANTVRNKGISFQEGKVECWNLQLSDEDFARACAEIRGEAAQSEYAGSCSPEGFRE